MINEVNWQYPNYDENITQGDMPGDKIKIVKGHEDKAKVIFPLLMEELKNSGKDKIVVSIYGGSGVGKTGVASLLRYYLEQSGIQAYRIPKYNDLKREEVYKEKGREGLENYLGSELEINFKEVNEIIRLFHAGEKNIYLRRMGRNETDLDYEAIDFSNVRVLILEWTHGNNAILRDIDYPIFLASTPKETLAHRMERNRDKDPDSPFVTMVLEIEQNLLTSQAPTAKWLISKANEVISCEEFMERIHEE